MRKSPLTREFTCDLFLQNADQADWHILMVKDYCLELSGSAAMTDAVRRMHPSVAQQAMYDGHLYAVPTRISFKYYRINKETRLNAGYALDQVTRSLQ